MPGFIWQVIDIGLLAAGLAGLAGFLVHLIRTGRWRNPLADVRVGDAEPTILAVFSVLAAFALLQMAAGSLLLHGQPGEALARPGSDAWHRAQATFEMIEVLLVPLMIAFLRYGPAGRRLSGLCAPAQGRSDMGGGGAADGQTFGGEASGDTPPALRDDALADAPPVPQKSQICDPREDPAGRPPGLNPKSKIQNPKWVAGEARGVPSGSPAAAAARHIAAAVVGVLILWPIVYAQLVLGTVIWQMLHAGAKPPVHPVLETALRGSAWGDWGAVQLLVGAVVVAPLAEELFFRGLLLGALCRHLRRAWPAVVASGAAFGLFHIPQPQDVLPLATMGVVLGYLRLRCGSLWPCILLHALFNARPMIETLAGQSG